MHHERSERHVRADRAYPLDDHRERRGRVLLLGKGAVLTQRVAGPLAAELDEYGQRPAKTRSETPAAPLIAGVFTGGALTPARDDEHLCRLRFAGALLVDRCGSELGHELCDDHLSEARLPAAPLIAGVFTGGALTPARHDEHLCRLRFTGALLVDRCGSELGHELCDDHLSEARLPALAQRNSNSGDHDGDAWSPRHSGVSRSYRGSPPFQPARPKSGASQAQVADFVKHPGNNEIQ